MKKSNILWLLSAILCLASCNNDDADYNVLNTQKVSLADDFVDERDGKIYKCVKIGNQIWMAENLAYYIPKGQLAGCYIWGEAEMDQEKLDEELAKLGDPLDDEGYMDLYDKTYDMGWGVYIPAEDEKLYEHFWDLCHYGLYTMETSLAYLKENCPEFYAIFYAKIEALLMTEEDLILQRTKEHSDKYERNFTKEDGYFYTLDGAKAAVPEGWRIPSDEDWKKLEAALGMASDLDAMNAWRGINAGDYLKVGGEAQFNAIYTGCNAWVYEKDDSNYWVNHDYSAYFWCSDETTRVETETSKEGETDEDGNLKEEESVVIREGIVRQLAIYSPKIWRGVTRLDNNVCYSVRCVKDVN